MKNLTNADARDLRREIKKRNLTKGQQSVLDFINAYGKEHGQAPSLSAIAGYFGYTVSNAHQILQKLSAKGVLVLRSGIKGAYIELPLSLYQAARDIPELAVVKGDFVHVRGARVVGITKRVSLDTKTP